MRKKVAKARKTFQELDSQIKKTMEEEKENFLFMASDTDVIIKGMHYPDSGFHEEEDIPMIWKTSDKNTYIAAWPQGEIRKMLEKIEDNSHEDQWEENWRMMLQNLMDISVQKLSKIRKDLK